MNAQLVAVGALALPLMFIAIGLMTRDKTVKRLCTVCAVIAVLLIAGTFVLIAASGRAAIQASEGLR